MASYYIATGLERIDAHRQLRERLEARGHQLTYDWTVHGSVKQTTPHRLQEVAAVELSAVVAAQFLVVLLPGGCGTHTEMGAGLAMGKPVFLHSENPDHFRPSTATCAFYHHPHVRSLCCPLDDLSPFVDLIETELSASLTTV